MTSLKQISGVNLRWRGFFTTWYRCSYLENMHYGQSWSFMNERISSSVFFFTRAWQIFRLSYNPYSHINDYSSVHAELLWRSVHFNIQIQGITFLQFWPLKLVFYLGQIYSKLLIKVEPTRNTKLKNTHNQLSNQINQKPNIQFVLFLFL